MTREQFLELMRTDGCCLLGICCPPGGAAQRETFRKAATAHGLTEVEADTAFDAAVAKK